MKRLTAIILALVLCLSLAACGGSTPANSGSNSGSAANSSAGNTASGEPEYKFSISWEASETSTGGMALVFFKKHIEELTNGRIQCDVYQNAALGTSREVIEGIQNQQITMMLCTTTSQTNFVPDIAVFELPFVFESSKDTRDVTQDPGMRELITKAYRASGFHWLGAIDGGTRTLAANKIIKSAADMKGLVVRTQDCKYHLATWNAIGANATPLAFAELFTALQQGTVDAQENPVDMFATNKLYDVQKYIYNTNHNVNCYMMIMNEDFYQSLPDDLKAACDEAAQLAAEDCWNYYDSNYDANVQTIIDHGTEFIELPPETIDEFRTLSAPVWDTIKGEVDPEMYDYFTKYLGF